MSKIQCEPQPVVTDDGFTDWVCPKPIGYLMQCCDCGLVHEAQFRVAKYEPRPSDMYEVVEDPDMQAQFRMRGVQHGDGNARLRHLLGEARSYVQACSILQPQYAVIAELLAEIDKERE